MNKKIIALIIVALVVIGAIIGAFAMLNKSNDSENIADSNNLNGREENTNISQNTQSTQNNNDLTNNDEENDTTNNNNQTNTGKALVLYFSQSGNTETVANFIHDEVGGDIVKLETSKAYPSDYNELVDYAQEEQRNNVRPELKTKINNIDDYDVIFLGYPNWWGDMPMALYTFLDEYDLSGKTIAPFITHGGSGLSGTPAKIRREEPNATVTEGLSISGSSAKSSKSTVTSWLSKIGF